MKSVQVRTRREGGPKLAILLRTYFMDAPFAYCASRWVEDKKVADRAVEIWPNIKKGVEKWEKLAPSKRLKGKNYQTVFAAIKDNLVTAKLNYFSFIA